MGLAESIGLIGVATVFAAVVRSEARCHFVVWRIKGDGAREGLSPPPQKIFEFFCLANFYA